MIWKFVGGGKDEGPFFEPGKKVRQLRPPVGVLGVFFYSNYKVTRALNNFVTVTIVTFYD